METIKGTVKKVKNDKKGVMLDNDKWYSNNFKGELNVNIGDEVEVEYKINGSFNNYESVKVLTKAQPVSKVSSRADPSTMLLSYAKDLTAAGFGTLKQSVEEILIRYYRVKQVLASPDDFLMKYEKEITGEIEKSSEKAPVVKPEEL